ncbi:MAG: hypothetical protein EA422_02895 [Gemmatimonadales bacterium]|nr:MAG: hypothetical protein EA422_02895 [Gemmatimonadales bacterium]
MIVVCNYEEVTALSHGARSFLGNEDGTGVAVAAPPSYRIAVEALLPRLSGDFSLNTLAEQEEVEKALRLIVSHLRETMDSHVLATHAAAEEAVSAYFDYAHALTVLDRVEAVGSEMSALVELLTGQSASEEMRESFQFPD